MISDEAVLQEMGSGLKSFTPAVSEGQGIEMSSEVVQTPIGCSSEPLNQISSGSALGVSDSLSPPANLIPSLFCEITMNSNVYGKHKKPLVTFSHKKHNADYKIACVDCHHVLKDGKNVWKEGDDVQKCDTCHSEAKAPSGKDAPKLSKQEKIMKYHYSAIHENCVGCHKAEKKKGKDAPSSCKDCHLKK